MLGSPSSSSARSDVGRRRIPRQEAGFVRLEGGRRRFGEAWRGLDERGIEQRGEMVAERINGRLRGFGASFARGRLGRFGHALSMGAKREQEKGQPAIRFAPRADRGSRTRPAVANRPFPCGLDCISPERRLVEAPELARMQRRRRWLCSRPMRGDADLQVLADRALVEGVGGAGQLDLAVQRLVGDA